MKPSHIPSTEFELRLRRLTPEFLRFRLARALEPLASAHWLALPTLIAYLRLKSFKAGNRSWAGLIAECRYESDPR